MAVKLDSRSDSRQMKIQKHLDRRDEVTRVWQKNLKSYRDYQARVDSGDSRMAFYKDPEWIQQIAEELPHFEIIAPAAEALQENQFITWKADGGRHIIEGLIELITTHNGFSYYRVTVPEEPTAEEISSMALITF